MSPPALAYAPSSGDLRALAAVPAPDVRPVAAAPARTVSEEHLSDEALARRGAHGVDALYRRHHAALYRFCLGLLRDREEAADAAQSAWVRTITALSSSRTAVLRVRPWLYAIARNECLDRLRSGTGSHTVDISDLELAGGTAPEDRIEQRAELGALLDDLGTLSERQRSAIVLREMGGLDGPELAEALGTSSTRALGLVADARRCLIERRSGRTMPCEAARHELGRVRRRSGRLTAHLDCCPPCQVFERRRRGRALSSLGLAPWLFVRGLAERFAALAGGPVEAPVKVVAATILAGTVCLAGPLPDRGHSTPTPERREARVPAAPAGHEAAAARPARISVQRAPRRARPAPARAEAPAAALQRRRDVVRAPAVRRAPAPAATRPVAAETPAATPVAAPAPTPTRRVAELTTGVRETVDELAAGHVVTAVQELVSTTEGTVRGVLEDAGSATRATVGALEALTRPRSAAPPAGR